jgi:hypothetical protein
MSVALQSFSRPIGAPLLKNSAASSSAHSLDRNFLFSERFEKVFQQAHRDRVLIEMAPTTLYAKAIDGLNVTIDGLSLLRNTTNAGAMLKDAGSAMLLDSGEIFVDPCAVCKVASFIGGMAIAGGSLMIANGLNSVRNGIIKLSKDYQNGNWEGAIDHASLGLLSGTSCTTLGSAMVITHAAKFAGALGTAAVSGLVATTAGFVLNGFFAFWAGYGLSIDYAFRSELTKHLQDGPDAPRLLSAMLWLSSQVRGGSTKAQLEKKWDQFVFRTSEACCPLVREKITPELLKGLEANDPAALKEANFILQEVTRASAKKVLRHTMFMAVALIGIIAFLCGILFATGPFAPLLFATGAILWFLLDSSKAFDTLGNRIFGKSEIPAATVSKDPEPIVPLIESQPVSRVKLTGSAGQLAGAALLLGAATCALKAALTR